MHLWAFSKRLALASGFIFTLFWLLLSPVGLISLRFFFLPKLYKPEPKLYVWTEARRFARGLTMAEIHQGEAEAEASRFGNALGKVSPWALKKRSRFTNLGLSVTKSSSSAIRWRQSTIADHFKCWLTVVTLLFRIQTNCMIQEEYLSMHEYVFPPVKHFPIKLFDAGFYFTY